MLLLALATTHAQAGAQYRTTSDWGSGFNGEIVVTNPNNTPLDQWTLEFDFPNSINNIWDAKIASRSGNHYVVKSAGWNDSIAPGGTVSFGFGGSPGNVKNGPTNFVLKGKGSTQPNPTPTPQPTVTPKPQPTATPAPQPTATPTPQPPATGKVQVTITQNSGWNGGFGADLEIANNTDKPFDGWTLRFGFTPTIQSLWNGVMTGGNGTYSVKNETWNSFIAPGAKVKLGFSATGTLENNSASAGTLNGVPCTFTIVAGSQVPTPTNPTGNNIVIAGVDGNTEATQINIGLGASSYALSLSKGGNGRYVATLDNPGVAAASTDGNTLTLNGLVAGRAGLKLEELGSGAVRYLGVRVGASQVPAPNRFMIGSVSEDTDEHLNFWREENHRVDARYIYLNGGPQYGWTTWTNIPGDRATRYIRESKKLGMMPIFVWYNIPDGGESYTTDLEHIQSVAYMREYYKMLQLLLGIIKTESPDDAVGLILEPDFLGYLAQNAGKPASQIGALTSAAYDVGALKRGVDPDFPDTVKGLVESINYLISRDTPQSYFGWQMNLWASPAGGWTTPVPGKGLMHLTDGGDVAAGRAKIYGEASAITRYYLDAGIKSYGADFVSIDKYGLDAASAEAAAASDPANSLWFWNLDQWNNYLVFVRAMHETADLPVVLWQLPIGHINSSQMPDPNNGGRLFPDLTNNNRQGEDSTSTFFFGDTFVTSGKRYAHFSLNRGGDAAFSTQSGGAITWGEHLSAAQNAGVTMALFGAGVGASTTNIGNPPSDNYWWITKVKAKR